MSKRKYGSKTMRPARVTYSDKLEQAETYQEVLNLEMYDYVRYISANDSWLNSFPSPEATYIEREDSHKRYNNLLDEIESVLTEKDASLRYVAGLENCSHESVRKCYAKALKKLRGNIKIEHL